MSYPTVPLSVLSENARTLYGSDRTELTLDRDWLQPDAHRMSSYALRPERQLDPDFTPNDELQAAIDELVEAGYAWHAHSNLYGIRRVDPKHFTVATGKGPWIIAVSRVTHPGLTPAQDEDGALLAVLDGADITTRTGTGSGSRELHLTVRVPSAYDEEHDPATAARIELQLPTFPEIYGSRLTFWGSAGAAHLYPMGTDPRLIDARDHTPIDKPVRCGGEYCQGGKSGHKKHVFAPYQPPAVDLQRALLHVEARLRTPAAKSR